MKWLQLNKLFAVYRQVFCVCEHCDEVFRLSDGQVVDLKNKIPNDWLGSLEIQKQKLERQLERAETWFEKKRLKIIDAERRNAQRACNRIIHSVVPHLKTLKLQSNDVRSIFSPVQFIAFSGLSAAERTKKILFLDTLPDSKGRERVHKSLIAALKKGNYEWATYRVANKGHIERD